MSEQNSPDRRHVLVAGTGVLSGVLWFLGGCVGLGIGAVLVITHPRHILTAPAAVAFVAPGVGAAIWGWSQFSLSIVQVGPTAVHMPLRRTVPRRKIRGVTQLELRSTRGIQYVGMLDGAKPPRGGLGLLPNESLAVQTRQLRALARQLDVPFHRKHQLDERQQGRDERRNH